jgi:hypothetical protein
MTAMKFHVFASFALLISLVLVPNTGVTSRLFTLDM